MASAKGNAAWRALSETHTRDGRPVEPLTPEQEAAVKLATAPQNAQIVPSTIRRWLAAFLPEVAAGRLDLDELLAVVDEDLTLPPAPCPVCGRPYRRSDGPAWRHGICVVCYLDRLREAHVETAAKIEAKRGYDAAKTHLRRLRDNADPDRLRGHAPFRVCASCGERLPSLERHPEDRCITCRDRDEGREHDGGGSDDGVTM